MSNDVHLQFRITDEQLVTIDKLRAEYLRQLDNLNEIGRAIASHIYSVTEPLVRLHHEQSLDWQRGVHGYRAMEWIDYLESEAQKINYLCAPNLAQIQLPQEPIRNGQAHIMASELQHGDRFRIADSLVEYVRTKAPLDSHQAIFRLKDGELLAFERNMPVILLGVESPKDAWSR